MLMRVGRRTTPALLDNLRAVLTYLELGHWVEHTPSALVPQVVEDDTDLFELALARVVGERPIYLEFGVYKGRSMRWWSQRLPHAGAKLVGFDSFEGLPEDWRPNYDAGAFLPGDHRASMMSAFRLKWAGSRTRSGALRCLSMTSSLSTSIATCIPAPPRY